MRYAITVPKYIIEMQPVKQAQRDVVSVCLQLEIVYARWIVCSLSLYRDNLWRLINGGKKRIPSPLMSLWIDRQAIRRCNARHTRPITRLEIEFAANRYLGRHKESISERKSQLAKHRSILTSTERLYSFNVFR